MIPPGSTKALRVLPRINQLHNNFNIIKEQVLQWTELLRVMPVFRVAFGNTGTNSSVL